MRSSVKCSMWDVPTAQSRRRGMCCVCLREEESKGSVNSASIQNVCARTVLTESSSNKQQLQGTVKIWRNYCHIQFCVVAWEMEDKNKINFLFNIFFL